MPNFKVKNLLLKIKNQPDFGLFCSFLFLILFIIFISLTNTSSIHAEGLVIPSGSNITVIDGTLAVAGSINLQGSLGTPNGAVGVTKNWKNTLGGQYTAGAGTVFFYGAGSQVLDSGGTGSAQLFYNLAHTGTGSLTVQSNNLNIDNDFLNTNGSFLANGQRINVAGNWRNTATFIAAANTVTFDGTNQEIEGSTTFYNFAKAVTLADTMTFDSTGTQVITGTLVMHGTIGQLLTLQSDNPGTQWGIKLQSGGFQVLSYLAVQDSDAQIGVGLTLIAGPTSTNLGNNLNWVFATATLVWDGSSNTDWNNATNWDLGFIPGVNDSVIIPSAPVNQPILEVPITISGVTINSGARLKTDGKNFSITGTLVNNGNFYVDGNETISIGVNTTTNGSFIFLGDGDGTADTFVLPDFGTTDYYNLVITGTQDSFATASGLTTAGFLKVSSKTLDLSGDSLQTTGSLIVNGGHLLANTTDVDVNGDILITSGTFTAPAAGESFMLAGDFIHSTSGTFIASTGTLVFDGTNQGILGNANNAFSSIKKVISGAADTFTFSTSSEQTVSGTLMMRGESGNILSIVSDTLGVQGTLTLQSSGKQYLDYLGVRDNDASGGLTLIARNSSETAAGTTDNWVFGGTLITWQGDISSAWNNPSNWDLGIVPTTADTAVVPAVSGFDPVLDVNAAVSQLQLGSGGSNLTTSGFNLLVSGTLSNQGTIILQGNETYSFGVIDSDSGKFNFVGDGTGSALTIADLGSTDYYNLVINDTNPTKNTFLISGTLTVAGSLIVTSSTLNISTNAADLVTTGSLVINGGHLLATDGRIDANSGVIVTSGTLTAPDAGGYFRVADDWTMGVTGTFIHSSGNVTFDSAATATITGNTRFSDFTSTTAGKNFIFEAGSNQTIEDDFTIFGALGNLIVLDSSASPTEFNLTFPNGPQFVTFLNVQDSDAFTNDVTCFNCTDAGNNNSRWIFTNVLITVPEDGTTVDETPTVIGIATPGATVDIKDSTGTTTYGTATADANGNFRVELTTPVPVGAGQTLRPFIAAAGGSSQTVTVVASPTTAQQPTITSHADGDRLTTLTPTIAGVGALSTTGTILAADGAGDLLLTVVGTFTTAADGSYSQTLTTSLPKGTIYISTTIGGVASDILQVLLVDPYGVVFNSSTNELIEGASVTIINNNTGLAATPGVELDSSDVNPVVTGTNGFYSFLTIDGSFSLQVAAGGFIYPSTATTFDPGRSIITGSKAEIFSITGSILNVDLPVDPNPNVIRLEKHANKSEAKIGDIVTYTIDIKNNSGDIVTNFNIEDTIPPGFKYVSDRVLLDGIPVTNPSGNRPLVFNISSINGSATRVLKYQLVIGSGVTMGDYNNTAVAKNGITGVSLSNMATETVMVIPDPLFDLGTSIGKVFYDRNENGIQDAPTYYYPFKEVMTEEPVPNVRIAMEDGAVITTDKEGRFSIPALTPGRHLFRLDERTLPEGAYLTTDKVVVVDITPGLMVKVNFGINIISEEDQTEDQRFFASKVKVDQDQSKPQPRLSVGLFQDNIAVYNGLLVQKGEFRIFSNYVPFIERWKLTILDEENNKIIRQFSGDRLDIFDPILWDGKDEDGEYISLERKYIYRVTVEDKQGKFDETETRALNISEFQDELEVEEYQKVLEEKRKTIYQWTKRLMEQNDLKVQTILVDGETVTVDRLGTKLQSVRLMKDGELVCEIPIIERKGLTAQEIVSGANIDETDAQQRLSIIIPKGTYSLLIQEKTQEAAEQKDEESVRFVEGFGEIKEAVKEPLKTYSKQINIGDDQLFFVAMGDGKIGYTFTRGNIEPVATNDRYRKGFYSEGKLAYYVKGKILGKYLITSSFDTQRQRKEIFRNLDPEEYYPVYGDASEKNYDATNTQGNLYTLIEWDKSSVIWGNYNVGFDETEFGQYVRSLYGGKIDYESLSTTKFGQSRTKVVAFRAKAQQKSAHNEFLATGGSLYFLKNKDVIEGSDKIRIEVRDKITGLVITSKDMVEGADYEIDYRSGRVIFWQPIPVLVESYSIISDDLLRGNLVYVVSDYEYEVLDKVDEATVGYRARQAIGENVIVGTTYVSEEQQDKNYQLRATDITITPNKDSQIVAEIAESLAQAQDTFVSTDGGLSFAELATNEDAKGKAYGLRGNALLFNRLGVSAYYKWIDNDFSTSATTAQQGKELSGFELTYDISDRTKVSLRQDIQRLLDDGNLQTQLQVGASKSITTMAQIVHQLNEKLILTGEYQHKTTQDSEEELDIVAVRAEYQFNENLIFSMAHQQALNSSDYQTTIGVTAKPTEILTMRFEEVIGSNGTATKIGVIANLHERITLTGDYILTNELGTTGNQWSVGAISQLNKKIQLYTSLGISSEGGFSRAIQLGGAGTKTIGKDGSIGGEFGVDDKNAKSGKVTASGKGITGELGSDGSASATFGGKTQVDENTEMISDVTVAQAGAVRSATIGIGGHQKVDEKTEVENKISFTEDTTGISSTAISFGTKKKLTDDLELTTARIFGTGTDAQSTESQYGLAMVRNGRKLTGTLSRKYEDKSTERSRSNIFGLSGEIDDRWAAQGVYERALVENLDGTETQRDVLSTGVGYVKKDQETGLEMLKSSTKVEVRFDNGDENRRQYLVTNVTEGKVTPEISVSVKGEISQTVNTTTDTKDAEHKELSVGAAYRPVLMDQLNLLGRYTYLENKSPDSQDDISDIEEESAHVISLEAIYDLNKRWQFTEKFAFRIGNEKVAGFDFTQTHTWLMIHRLSYKIDQDWMVNGEYRMLTQREAQDKKQGMLLEVTRKVGEYAQMGLGYDWTDFTDDLTDLDYSTYGPFLRMTGKLYDQTQDEVARTRQKWLNEKIDRWSWMMMMEELEDEDSPIIRELNDYFVMAQMAYDKGDYEESRRIYKDIIIAGQMMHDEAAEYIHKYINKEQHLRELNDLADQYYKNKQFEKAKKILEKILEEAQKPVLE